MLPEPADGEVRSNWRWARGQKAVCKHDKRRPVPTLDLETGESAITVP